MPNNQDSAIRDRIRELCKIIAATEGQGEREQIASELKELASELGRHMKPAKPAKMLAFLKSQRSS
jgi:hypothetical protein